MSERDETANYFYFMDFEDLTPEEQAWVDGTIAWRKEQSRLRGKECLRLALLWRPPADHPPHPLTFPEPIPRDHPTPTDHPA